MKELVSLFLTFARIGAFTFGGGYAMLSLIEHTCVEKKKWITHDEMMKLKCHTKVREEIKNDQKRNGNGKFYERI